MGRVGFLAFGLLIGLLGPLICSAQDFSANLTGSAVVPWVQSPGYAQVYLKFYETNDGHADSTQADYVVNVWNIGGITSVGLYQAPIGSNGELVAWLYGWNGTPNRAVKNGTLTSNTLKRGDLKGPDATGIVSDLEARANDGDLYALITTLNNPDGELRGQVVHPYGFSLSTLPILGPPVAPVEVPVPVIIPTIIASPVPVPVPAPVPAPFPAPPPPAAVIPVVTAVPVPVPVPAPASPPPSPSPSPAAVVTTVPVPVPVPIPAPASPPPSPSPSPVVAAVPVNTTSVPAVVRTVPAATPSPAVVVAG